jgi:hypothetical protein
VNVLRTVRFPLPIGSLLRSLSEVGLVSNWEEFLVEAINIKDETIRKMSRTGRPAGDAAYVRFVERLTARDLSKGKPGRPAKMEQ